MTHRFPLKEIALQSGLSTATVDRVINDRPNVSGQSRARVAAAIEELRLQEGQLAARGRRMFVDVIVEAPKRFSQKIRHAIETVLPQFQPAVIRPRFTFQEVMSEEQALAHLDRVLRRGSSGVCLKLRDLPAIRFAVKQLRAKGIPVVTMFTDLDVDRTAYVGVNNYQAGQIAAYLMMQTLQKAQNEAILLTTSQASFAGEDARAHGFRAAVSGQGFRLINVDGAGGLATQTAQMITARAQDIGALGGVYSMGGGNRAILQALGGIGAPPRVFIGHDLDVENRALLREGHLHYVLDHDLRGDLHHAFAHIAAAHGLGRAPETGMSDVQILTPIQVA